MAHEIGQFDGIALNRVQAWHNLGTVINTDMSPKEALVHAGLDWKVGFPERITATFPNGDERLVKSRTLFRLPNEDGTGPYVELGTVKSQYVPLQNDRLFDIAYAVGADVKVESAGSLFNGKKIFCLLRGDTIKFGHNDVVETYLALLNSHDGTLALSGLPTSTRIVCNNTLSLALKTGSSKMYKVKHCATMEEQVKELEEALTRFKQTGSMFVDKVEALRKREIATKELMEFWTRAYVAVEGAPETEFDKEHSVVVMQQWAKTFEAEMEALSEPANMWLAANAVTNWVQNREPGRNTATIGDSRYWKNLAGDTQDKSVEVFNLALALR